MLLPRVNGTCPTGFRDTLCDVVPPGPSLEAGNRARRSLILTCETWPRSRGLVMAAQDDGGMHMSSGRRV